MTEGKELGVLPIYEILPRSSILSLEEVSFVRRALWDLLKVKVTLLSLYCLICESCELGLPEILAGFEMGSTSDSGGVASSKFQWFGRWISFHWKTPGRVVLDFVRSVCKKRVSPRPDYNLCIVGANAEIMAL